MKSQNSLVNLGGIYLCPYGPELRTDYIDQSEEASALPSLALFLLVHLHSELIQTLQSAQLKQCKFGRLDSSI